MPKFTEKLLSVVKNSDKYDESSSAHEQSEHAGGVGSKFSADEYFALGKEELKKQLTRHDLSMATQAMALAAEAYLAERKHDRALSVWRHLQNYMENQQNLVVSQFENSQMKNNGETSDNNIKISKSQTMFPTPKPPAEKKSDDKDRPQGTAFRRHSV